MIGTSRRAMRGEVQVKGTPIAYESALERDLLITLDFIPTAREVCGQPVTIPFTDATTGARRRYTPDVAVRFDPPIEPRHPGGLILEVKYRDDLFASWPTLKPRFKAARAYAAAHQARFAILTEREIRTPLFHNIMFLRPYLSRTERPEHLGFEEKLIATLMAYEEATPEITLLAGFACEDNRMRALPTLWRLVAQGRIGTDLTRPLTMTTPIWVAGEEAATWTDPHSYVLRPLLRCAADRERIASHMRSIWTVY
ncbi:TnsA endonuclease N-terminal domain-containing protein [Methylorubrum aminovorans]|uniref:TnsA endonuclease N-terminal domain-containing protein n=1 Tax=Methylorubrum aminovorans TaxID=269069 RepID=UPI003C2AED51